MSIDQARKTGARLLLGNEAIALGLWEAGCRLAAAYPGTPSSEVMESLSAVVPPGGRTTAEAEPMHLEWSVNEKVAVEVASAASLSGLRSAAVMKQVGLNVAMDPLMSLAYTGVVGGMLLIVADDPGPFSSQTEQDTRTFAMAAGVPVLDPSTPEEAREMVHLGYTISERFRVPVILRPVLRVCHSRAPVSPPRGRRKGAPPGFRKDPSRWAATPGFRHALHLERDRKLVEMAKDPLLADTVRFLRSSARKEGPLAILASGAAAGFAADALDRLDLAGRVPLLAAGAPFPLDGFAVAERLEGYERVLVLEETEPVLERQLCGLLPLSGRGDGSIPGAGEMTPDIVEAALARHLPASAPPQGGAKADGPDPSLSGGGPLAGLPAMAPAPAGEKAGAPPTLCAGCPHRASFWALRKAIPRGIYAGDIGCYTLGIALGAVDTVLCMGASIAQASGFYWAHRELGDAAPPVAATIGDSTFFHSGVPPLANAVLQGAAFTLLILDNSTTAMTGGQPTPAAGPLAGGGEPGSRPSLEALALGCGVKDPRVADPLDFPFFQGEVEAAARRAREGEVAVVIARSPCVLSLSRRQGPVPQLDRERCTACRLCTDRFGCPALVWKEEGLSIEASACPGCGACVHVCPQGAIGKV